VILETSRPDKSFPDEHAPGARRDVAERRPALR
jgi:hypothetical protein